MSVADEQPITTPFMPESPRVQRRIGEELVHRGLIREADIANALKDADTLILATDPDREGEAISWHIVEALKKRRAL